MQGAKEMIDEIISKGREILFLQKEFEKRYGIRIISVTPDFYLVIDKGGVCDYITHTDGVKIQVDNGMKELSDLLGCEILGKGEHYSLDYAGCEISTVTKGGRRFLKAKKRNNKWTRGDIDESENT